MVSTYNKFIVMDLSFDHGKTLCNKKQKANEVQQTLGKCHIYVCLYYLIISFFILFNNKCLFFMEFNNKCLVNFIYIYIYI